MKLFILRDKYCSFSLAISALLIFVGFGIAYFALRDVDYLLFLHFSPSGIDFLGTKADVFSILFIAATAILVNFSLANFFFKRIRFFSRLLSVVSIFFSILILIAIAVIISVN